MLGMLNSKILSFFLIGLFLLAPFVFAQGGEGQENSSAFIQSLTVIVREGVEAILIIAAILAYLVMSKNQDKARHVYIGVVLAILASIATAFLLDQVFVFGEEQEELLEGITLLLAAVVLLYVTNWMLSKAEAVKWQKYIKGKVQDAVSHQNTLALILVAFLAVYREGFETVLFLKALFLQTQNTPEITLGIGLGFVLLAGIAVAIFKLGMRIPINKFFLTTSALIFFFSFTFVGTGVHELQEAHVLPETELGGVPRIALLGIYPTLETIAAQFLVLLFGAIMAYIHVFRHHDLDK